jgi:hypothetical protein
MRIASQQDFYSGLLFAVVGAVFAWGASTYEIGTAARMGPGYFPRLLGILTAGLGLIVMLKSIVVRSEVEGRIGAWAWKPLFLIIAANLAIGVMLGGLPAVRLPALGLILGIYALTFIASLAGDDFRAKEVFLLATVLAVMSYLGCVMLLKLQFQVWPDFLAA